MPPPRTFIIAFVAFAVFALLAACVASAQPGPDAVGEPAVTLKPAVATVGDRLTLTIAIDHEDGVTLTPPGFGGGFGGLEVVEIAPPADEERGAGRRRTTFTYTLTAFTPGSFTVPPRQVTFAGPGAASGAVETAARTVTINSVLAPGDASLRPLKPQLEIDSAAPAAAVPVLVVAAFAVLTAAGYLLHVQAVRIPPPAPVAAPAPPPPPQERALAALDATAPLADADVRAYYARIAATLRAYLSERYAFPAYAMTRTEMERGMEGAGIERWPARLTANLLEQCDAAQFAGFVPAAERRAADLAAAREIVALTA